MAENHEVRNSWVVRVIRKWVWILGFFPYILDFLGAYFPKGSIPSQIRVLLAQGTTWSTTMVLFSVGLLISAFLVGREDRNAIESLTARLQTTTQVVPDIDVKLSYDGSTPSELVRIPLDEKPEEPDYDDLVEQERKRLTRNTPTIVSSGTIYDWLGQFAQLAAASAMQELNPDYEREVEEYLADFRKYLIISYEMSISRAFCVKPLVVNQGLASATLANLELIMPDEYQRPKEHQAAAAGDLNEFDLDYYINRPIEPRPYKNPLSLDYSFPRIPSAGHILPAGVDNPYEPEISLIDGVWRVGYRLGELVPKREVRDLEPFVIWAGAVEIGDEWSIRGRAYAKELGDPQTIDLAIRFISAE